MPIVYHASLGEKSKEELQMKDHDYLTDDYLHNTARPILDTIFADTGARNDLLDSLTQYAHWRIDAVRNKLEKSEKYKELQERTEALSSRLKSQVCAQQWDIAQEWDDTKHAMSNMHNEMLFLAGVKEGIALCGMISKFK
jgi:hypothetical protein